MIPIFQYFADNDLEQITTKHQNEDSDFEDVPDEPSLQDFEVLGIKSVNIYKACPARGEYIILTHWGLETHICVSKLTIIGSDNGFSPGRRQAIIWTNARILLIGPLGTNFSEILIEIHTFSFKKMHLKMASAKWRPFCIGLNELKKKVLIIFLLDL